MADKQKTAIPRFSFEELPPALANLLAPRYRRLGYLGEFFRCMAHQPLALADFVNFTEHAKSTLDKRTIEIIALTVASASGNTYERNQHERLSIRSGLSRDWVRAVESLNPAAATELSNDDRAIQRWVLAIARQRFDEAREAYENFARVVGPETAIAALMVVGRYVAHTAMAQTLGLQPPVPSIFEDDFNGD